MTESHTDQAQGVADVSGAEQARVDAEQAQLGPSAEGSVMLDIGGDVGALVLHTGANLLLAEVEVSRVDCGYPLAAGYQLPHQHHLGEGHDDSGGHSHGGSDDGHSHDVADQHTHSHGGVDAHPNSVSSPSAESAEFVALRTHVAVRERRAASGVRYAAIYAGLLSGDYRLWNLDGTAGDIVTIVGGQVTEHDWR